MVLGGPYRPGRVMIPEITHMPPSLASHPDVLWIIILALFALLSGVLHGAGVFIMRLGAKTLTRLETKVDGFLKEQNLCRQELPKLYLNKLEFKDWGEGRDELWQAINNHRHAPDGGVIRSDGWRK